MRFKKSFGGKKSFGAKRRGKKSFKKMKGRGKGKSLRSYTMARGGIRL